MDNSRNRFKKIYIEISNICNLNCPFCLKSERAKKSLNFDSFKIILNKIKPYTQYLYFHVLGEPLFHNDINKFILEASKDFYINITTNGYLIKKLDNKLNIRQINISMHSYDEKYKKTKEEYIKDIFDYIDNNSNKTYINLRLWVKNKNKDYFIDNLEKKFNISIPDDINNICLSKNVYLNFDQEFDWPDINNKFLIDDKPCYALREHIAILSDGTIVPCCLDGNGVINLGNIFTDELKDVINSNLYQELLNGFLHSKRIHPLCKKCNFYLVKNDK